ncbi:hypothetical protein K469DRAFT_449630, partial [Zopfia rhizophila CBS 207.26]
FYRKLSLGVIALYTTLVYCIGTASIKNLCNFAVYVWSIANVPNNTVSCLEPLNGHFNEMYRTNPNGGGISLKISTKPDDINITQFEYTVSADNPDVYYDISNIDGYPFQNWGFTLSSSSPSCSSIFCSPGLRDCPYVFNQPNDTFAVKSCNVLTNLTLTLCP